MSDSSTPTHDHPPERHPTHDSAPPAALSDQALAPAPTPTYAPGILQDPRLHGRGNGAVRQAALLQLQRTQGNRATRRALQRMQSSPGSTGPAPVPMQRTYGDAQQYTPADPVAPLHPTFAAHHTTRGQPVSDAIAIGNHTTRAEDKPNTTVEFSAADARREIFRYLEDLPAGNLPNKITFTTRGAYPFIITHWNQGNPRSYMNERGHIILIMEWMAAGYYRIYHLEDVAS